jgi:hypothetical protein
VEGLSKTECFNNIHFELECEVHLETHVKFMRFQVLMAASMKIRAFWVMAPCSVVVVDRRFGGAYAAVSIRVILHLKPILLD